MTTIVKAISASPAMMTKPRRDDRRESASSQRSYKGKSENNILPVLAPSARQFSWAITVNGTERNLMAMGGAGCCCTSRAAGAKAAVAELSAARRAPIYTRAFHHCGSELLTTLGFVSRLNGALDDDYDFVRRVL